MPDNQRVRLPHQVPDLAFLYTFFIYYYISIKEGGRPTTPTLGT